MRTFNDPKLISAIEHSGNTCIDPDEVFHTVMVMCEENWPINKGKVTTKYGERYNSHTVTPEGIRNLMKEFVIRGKPEWYLINLIEWCNVKANEMNKSLLNYLGDVQNTYFKMNKIDKIALDDIEDEVVLKPEDTSVITPPVKEKFKRRSISPPAPKGHWGIRTIAKLANCTEEEVSRAIRLKQLDGKKERGKWIVPKTEAEKWIKEIRETRRLSHFTIPVPHARLMYGK